MLDAAVDDAQPTCSDPGRTVRVKAILAEMLHLMTRAVEIKQANCRSHGWRVIKRASLSDVMQP